MGIFMVGGIAVIASIMRIYALYIFAVSDDIEYDDIFVSPIHRVFFRGARQLTNNTLDPSSLTNRSKRRYDVRLRPSLPTSLREVLLLLLWPFESDTRRVPNYRQWRPCIRSSEGLTKRYRVVLSLVGGKEDEWWSCQSM
jgi:hypothetical protein